MCVAFMPVLLVVLECKRFSKIAFRSCPNSPENFPDFSGIYSHFPLSYFYLLEGSTIFIMSSKCFIWIVHVLICLWDFF
jgi:hypothetical protein